MEVEDAKTILKDWVKADRQIRMHRTESDYEQFCEVTCMAIETLIYEIEKYEDYFKGFKK